MSRCSVGDTWTDALLNPSCFSKWSCGSQVIQCEVSATAFSCIVTHRNAKVEVEQSYSITRIDIAIATSVWKMHLAKSGVAQQIVWRTTSNRFWGGVCEVFLEIKEMHFIQYISPIMNVRINWLQVHVILIYSVEKIWRSNGQHQTDGNDCREIKMADLLSNTRRTKISRFLFLCSCCP